MLQDVEYLMGETMSQHKELNALLERKQQLLNDDLPTLCTSIASLQCLDVIKVRKSCHFT